MTRPAILALAALAACGGETAGPARPAATRGTAAPAFDETPGGRVVVATVDGAPIYADCVATQARGLAGPEDEVRRRALDECVGFELLAREARRRGLDRDPDAIEAQKREAVRALIDREFAPTMDGPDDIRRSDLEKIWPKVKHYYDHDELRATYQCRVEVGKKQPRGGPADLEAEAFAKEVHAALIAQPIRTGQELYEACTRAAGDRKLAIARKPYRFREHGNVDPTYAAATFALKRAGDVTPPIRTKWGWDLIWLSEITPALHQDLAAAEPSLRDTFFYDVDFDRYRQAQFLTWAKQIGGTPRVQVFPERIPAQTDEERALIEGTTPAPPPAPAPPVP
jgi:hypothetical protein